MKMEVQSKGQTDRIRVWPEMILLEGLSILVAFIGLLLASCLINAPLEGIADPSMSMNPSKAPWYFLGLQELLVYFTPWVAGVAIPTAIVIGLAAIPYIDVASKNAEEKDVYRFSRGTTFFFSVGLAFWATLTGIGLFMRGPNWTLQWPNGTPIATSSAHPMLDWLMPLVIALYILFILVLRFSSFRREVSRFGFWRRCISHAFAMGSLAVTAKIIIAAIVDITMRS